MQGHEAYVKQPLDCKALSSAHNNNGSNWYANCLESYSPLSCLCLCFIIVVAMHDKLIVLHLIHFGLFWVSMVTLKIKQKMFFKKITLKCFFVAKLK